MAVIGELLFYGGGRRATLADVLRHNLDTAVRQAVDRLVDSDFRVNADEALAERVAAKCAGHPIVLRLEESVGAAEPTRVDVNDFFGGRAVVDGLRVTKSIPFDGEPTLFELQPDQFDLNPPRGEVSGRKLLIGMEVRQSDADEAVRYIEETLVKTQTYIERQAAAIQAYNAALPGAAIVHIQRRRGLLGAASDIASRLSGR